MKMIFALLLASILALPAFAQTPKPATTANDDSCDLSLLPAATLLLPYFEVDFNSPQTTARTTLFVIQNTTAMPQIARVTLWTDWSYPMLTFNIFLTGYDVQGINLYDIFQRGIVAPGPNQTSGGTSNKTKLGDLSLPNDQNPHFLPNAATTCASNPGPIDRALLADLQKVFTTGVAAGPICGSTKPVGSNVHSPNAVGYVTIDLVANCSSTALPSPLYFGELLYDNVLTGDYQDVNPSPATGNYAGGNPLVHIRAIPEGGPPGQIVATSLPYTFYDVYTQGLPFRNQDRRQPLPSAFMPRFINGGTGAFNTNFKIWREALGDPASCPAGYGSNSNIPFAEVVRFDEHENVTYPTYCCCITCPPYLPGTRSTSTIPANNTTLFPSFSSTSGDVGGWLFLNLNDGGSPTHSSTHDYHGGTTTRGRRQSQAWVITSMFAEGRYSVDMDAVAVGNGCSPAPDPSTNAPIGPAP